MSIRTYRTLDGIRGVAALSIVVLHTPRLWGGAPLPTAALAVDLFFCLSGFVLSHAYDHRFDRGMTIGSFMWIRFIRLYPLYLLGTLLGIAEALAAIRYQTGPIDWSWSKFWLSLPFALVMAPSPTTSGLFPFNGVMWSIFFELIINLIWAAFWRPFQSKFVIFPVIIFSAITFAITSWYTNTINLGLEWKSFLGGMARVSYGFFAGVIIYRYLPLLNLSKIPPVAIIVSVIIIFSLPIPKAVQVLVAIGIFPWLVALGAKVEPGHNVGRLCHILGLASYAMYALHRRLYMLGYAFLLKFVGWDARMASPWPGFVFLLFIVFFAVAVDKLYDNPVRKIMRRNNVLRINGE